MITGTHRSPSPKKCKSNNRNRSGCHGGRGRRGGGGVEEGRRGGRMSRGRRACMGGGTPGK